MGFSSKAFSEFYDSPLGEMAQRYISTKIKEFWPEVRHHSLLGIGYPHPYLQPYLEQAERTVLSMPPVDDLSPWPLEGKNKLCIAASDELPFPNEFFDRIMVVHCLEFLGNVPDTLMACWQALKPNGRMIIVVPNRLSMWMQADNTPFGFGTPFSQMQIKDYLAECNFHVERAEKALFVPPFETRLMQKVSPFFEKYGRYVLLTFGGVHVMEVSKKLYAPIKPDSGSRVEAVTRILLPKEPVPTS